MQTYENPHKHVLFENSALPSLQETTRPSSVATSPSGTAKSGSPFESALDSRTPLEHRLRSTARMYKGVAESDSTSSNQRKAVVWQEMEELECPVASSQV